MYKVKCCNEIDEKHFDQLCFCPDIETELKVKDIQSEQNLYQNLYPILLKQAKVIKQLCQAHRTINYQITPPVRHHLNILTTQYLLNQT